MAEPWEKVDIRIDVCAEGKITRLFLGEEPVGLVWAVEFSAVGSEVFPKVKVTLIDKDPGLAEKIRKLKQLHYVTVVVIEAEEAG